MIPAIVFLDKAGGPICMDSSYRFDIFRAEELTLLCFMKNNYGVHEFFFFFSKISCHLSYKVINFFLKNECVFV